MPAMAQFVIRKAKVVGATDQLHARFQRFKAMSGVTTFACQASSSNVLLVAPKYVANTGQT
jgi:hypothetical protein